MHFIAYIIFWMIGFTFFFSISYQVSLEVPPYSIKESNDTFLAALFFLSVIQFFILYGGKEFCFLWRKIAKSYIYINIFENIYLVVIAFLFPLYLAEHLVFGYKNIGDYFKPIHFLLILLGIFIATLYSRGMRELVIAETRKLMARSKRLGIPSDGESWLDRKIERRIQLWPYDVAIIILSLLTVSVFVEFDTSIVNDFAIFLDNIVILLRRIL